MATAEAGNGNATRDVIFIIIGVLLFTAGFMLLKNASGSSSGAGQPGTVILPSDAVQEAVISADQAEQSSSNALSATVSSNSLAAILGLTQAQAALKLGLAQTSASVQQATIAANGAAQIATIQSQAQENIAQTQAAAQDTQANYAAQIAAISTAGTEYDTQQTDAAQTAIAAQQAQAAATVSANQTTAEVNAADQARSAAGEQSTGNILSSLFSGVTSFLGKYFSSNPTKSGTSGTTIANVNDSSGSLDSYLNSLGLNFGG
jgi:hypothetical protein